MRALSIFRALADELVERTGPHAHGERGSLRLRPLGLFVEE